MSMLYRSIDGSLDEWSPALHIERGKRRDATGPTIWGRLGPTISFYGRPVPRLVGAAHREDVDLGAKLSRQIRELAVSLTASAKSGHAAQFNIFAAILFAYLNRVCGVERPSLGMPFHNRRDDLRKQTVGVFMSVLPLSVDVEESDTLNSLIAKIGADASSILRNSAYFIHNLMHTQAHDVLVNGLFAPFPVFAGVLCDYHWPLFRNVLDPILLNFYVDPATGSFANAFIFNSAIFDDEMRRLLIHDYDRMAHSLLDNPDVPIRDIELVSDEDKHRLLFQWNATDTPFPDDKTIHQLFETQAERTPGAVAVVFEDRTLTYRELNARANQLAHHLKGLGVERDVLVGLCVERSPEMAIGLLGILKAGGAYLPLDPAYPPERLAFMLEDSNVHILVTTERQRQSLPVNGATAVCLDRDSESVAARTTENPVNGVGAGNLAYVIYTSGSTGQPKGVAMPHRALANLVRWQTAHSEASDVRALVRLSFDVSFQEMFCTWATGGTLVLIDNETRRDPRRLLDTIAKGKVERLFLPYVALQSLAQTAVDTNTFPGCLKEVITAGEQLRVTASIRTFFSSLAACKLVNQYGPTESHVVSAYVLCGAPDEWPALPPIGRPIDNISLYVLNSSLQPVPGCRRLYIGGLGHLRTGPIYRRTFVPHSIPRQPRYRTGDIVLQSDGNIECLGRADHQVGPGTESSSAKSSQPCCSIPAAETIVVMRQDVPEDHELVAYIVPQAKDHEFNGELKAHLKRILPDYMIPSAFIVLDKLPLGPNGKVDRGALPRPNREARDVHDQVVAPRDAVELELAHIWEQIFDVRPIGVADSFFDLGGHSLSAVFLMDQIHLRFGKVLSPSVLFEASTIEALADVVRRHEDGEPEPVLVPIQPRGHKTPFFCVHPAPGTVFCYIALAQHLGESLLGHSGASVNGANVY